jgi:hypothetical protein
MFYEAIRSKTEKVQFQKRNKNFHIFEGYFHTQQILDTLFAK